VPRVEVGRISSKRLSWTAFINFVPQLEDFITCGRVEERVPEKNFWFPGKCYLFQEISDTAGDGFI